MPARPAVVLALLRAKHDALPAGQLDRIVAALEPAHVTLAVLDGPAELDGRLRELAAGADVLAIGGGDGTINAAIATVRHLAVPLLVIPLGTANDLARTLELPMDPVQAARLLHGGTVKRVDIGLANDRGFFNVASVGLSVEVAQRLADQRKHFGAFSYLIAAADVWRATRAFRIWIDCDGERVTMRSIQVSVGNGRFHGGGIAVADDAAIDDGRLDVYALEPQPWWRLMLMLPAMHRGRHRHWRTVTALQGRAVDLRTRRPRPVNVDGELLTYTPTRFRVVSDAVAVFAPAPDNGVQPPAVADAEALPGA